MCRVPDKLTDRARRKGDPISEAEAARFWAQFLQQDNTHGLAAFDHVYKHFLPAVSRYCRFRLGDSHQAEDTAHAVFIRLLEKRPVLFRT